jgi:hypothetical protein
VELAPAADFKDQKGIAADRSKVSGDQKASDVLVKEWKLYRCWISDLRFANLTSANLEGSTLGGVDFRWANLTGVNFCRADVSRANFQGAIGLDSKSLRDACAGGSGTGFDYAAQPVGLPSNFPTLRRCDNNYQCAHEKKPDKENTSRSPSTEPIQLGHNLALACFLAFAWMTFWLVGRYAKTYLEVAIGDQTVKFPSRFPERNRYSAAQLRDFVGKHPYRSRLYISPVLFPLDVIVMVLLGTSMAAASYYWIVRSLPVAWTSWAWATLIFPALYVVADLIEDTMLAWTLTRVGTASGGPVSQDQVRRLKRATHAKFLFISAAILQTVGALLVYGIITSCNWTYFAKACVGSSLPQPRIVLGWPNDWSFLDGTISRDQAR